MAAVALRFYPNQSNPKRPNGRGNWRVTMFLSCLSPGQASLALPLQGIILLRADREYKVGSRVDPRRILGV